MQFIPTGSRFIMASKDALKDYSLSKDSIGACGEIIEISGVIKWFDGSKGYGFIVPDLPNCPRYITARYGDAQGWLSNSFGGC